MPCQKELKQAVIRLYIASCYFPSPILMYAYFKLQMFAYHTKVNVSKRA